MWTGRDWRVLSASDLNMRCSYRLILLFVVCLQPLPVYADEGTNNTIEQIERELEEWRYPLLADVQQDKNNHLTEFTTDGCSGGLSDGWRYLARKLPVFKEKFGDKPPYEACCVTHDRAYWRGETENGFEKRLQADEALQQCVAEFGKMHRDEFAKEFSLSPQAIERNFVIVAALMYRAVRVGGIPCTDFTWRWGYGWPSCKEQDD